MDRPIRVLHVDDEPGFADLSADFLVREDDRFVVETATSTRAALDALAADPFDCVVSDYDMPEMDGIEFLETVREDHPNLPFVLYTGKGSEEVASDAISAGVTDYLQKQRGTDHYALLANRVRNAVAQSRTEQVAERTQQQLTELADNTDDVFWTFSGDWDELLFINDAYEDVWGRSVDALEAEPHDFLEGIHPADRDRARAGMEQLSGGDPVDIEFRVNEAESYGRWVWVKGTPITDDSGNVLRVVGFARDVTERKDHERDLERTNAVLSTLVDTLPLGVMAEDESRNVLAVNRRILDIFGRPEDPEELVGADTEQMAAIVSEQFEDPDAFIERTTELVAERERVQGEVWGLADGRTLERSHHPIELPGGHLWTYRDVTERVDHEQRLETLSETTRELMAADTREQVAEIGVTAAREVLGLDANGIHFYDDEASALVPVAVSEPARDIIGDPPTFTEGDAIAWRVYEDNESLALDDVQADPDVYRPDTPVRSEMFLPLGEHGVLTAGSTEPAAFDKQDLALGDVLAENIVTALEQVQQTAQLRARERELSKQNDRLSQFASVVSHDLRNPLNVAEGRLELVQETGETEHLDKVATAHERMQALIDDLLALTRDGTDATDVDTIELDALVQDCWATVDTEDATLVADATASVHGDESRVRQLFENLLRNAVEHGSTSPTSQARQDAVEHTAPGVTVTVGTLEDNSGFYVADDGPGIPDEERETVFEYGYSTCDAGTGFGLHIVEQVADAHGWTVSVTESDAGGARFEVTDVEADSQ
ncbi:response regulator [Halobacterium sp. KA-4]|uniref:receiver/sensor box histidine kinase n=1 Tax=Halobacterium sp. KA-4 TaxID=2896367 RepID=UPI001E3313F4|nr:response regulator [Halobacterium sp. KA-4]MCD2201207.1 response regulator [Halobacterium sp. KA-4]